VNTVGTLPELERVAGHVRAAMRAATFTHILTMPGAKPEEAAQGWEHAKAAATEASAALGLLGNMGVRPASVPTDAPIPPHLLDTPDARELLDLLRQAVVVADRLDQARGRALPPSFPLAEGEMAGCDLAEVLGNVAIRLETEIFGLADRRQDSGAGER
jgi:hypothetical protein